ncbi:MAG: hypothetical protein EBR82_54890 [Caulobacteraceae bacterium]|nr:hypothetical protein [Caulobacteraceae bacterium]
MWFSSAPQPQRLYENILRFRTLNTNIRVWIEREPEGPATTEDWALVNEFVQLHRQFIDSQSHKDTVDMLSNQFPRIAAIEVMDGASHAGVLLYPRWP